MAAPPVPWAAMGPVFAWCTPFVVGAGLLAGLVKKKHHDHKREADAILFGADAEVPVIYNFNSSNLRGHDITNLHGLHMNITAAGTAVFSAPGAGWEMQGNVTDNQPAHGLVGGALSFHVPGLDAPVQGTWITVDQFGGHEKLSDAFHKLHKQFETRKEMDQPSLEDLVMKFY